MSFLKTAPKRTEAAFELSSPLRAFNKAGPPIIQNVVATFSCSCNLNLKDISQRARNVEYKPKRFPAIIMRIKEPRSTALIFSTGKVVVTGAKTAVDSRLASRKFARIVQKMGYSNVKFTDYKVRNIVSSFGFERKLRLSALQIKYDGMVSYEPELFPGLIFRFVSGHENSRVVLLVFHSGKVVLTGVQHFEDVERFYQNFVPFVTSYELASEKPTIVYDPIALLTEFVSQKNISTEAIKIDDEIRIKFPLSSLQLSTLTQIAVDNHLEPSIVDGSLRFTKPQ